VDPRDEHGLVSALLQLLREPERRRAFGQAARVRLQERFMMTTVARQYCTFYQRVLAR
jgi:glycosyltransferase involved in cell wall biosynthesis